MNDPVAPVTHSNGGYETSGLPVVPGLLPSAAVWMLWSDLRRWVKNPRKNAASVPRVAKSIERFGFVAPIVVWTAANRMVAGDTRVQAMGQLMAADPMFCAKGAPAPGMVRVVFHDFDNEAEADLYALADNRLQELATWDDDGVAEILARYDANERVIAGYDEVRLPGDYDGKPASPGALQERFVVPPFSVLDARQGYWQERKRAWNALGIAAEEGREHLGATVATAQINRGTATGGSIFDPVLCEVAYRWFCPPGGHVLDPFGGECTKGVVAGTLGIEYTAIELRAGQVDANRKGWERVKGNLKAPATTTPTWVQGDSGKLDTLLPAGAMYDFVWTSPPYYDLEIYSKSDKDGSAFETYEKFIAWYADIFRQCVARLRDNRFLGVKIGEVRDKKTGAYRNFVGDNITVFRSLGLHYYNEAILVTPAGSMPLRAGKAFLAGRKLAKGHQNVLWFYKGDPRQIGKHFPDDIQAGEIDAENPPGTS